MKKIIFLFLTNVLLAQYNPLDANVTACWRAIDDDHIVENTVNAPLGIRYWWSKVDSANARFQQTNSFVDIPYYAAGDSIVSSATNQSAGLAAGDFAIVSWAGNSFTFEMYVNFKSTTGIYYIFSDNFLLRTLSTTQFNVSLVDGVGQTDYAFTPISNYTTTIHLFSVVVDRGTNQLTLYIDGVLQDDVKDISAKGDLVANTTFVMDHGNFLAKIHEIRISNKVRTQAEVLNYLNCHLAPTYYGASTPASCNPAANNKFNKSIGYNKFKQ